MSKDNKETFTKALNGISGENQGLYEMFMLKVDGEMTRRNRFMEDTHTRFKTYDARIQEIKTDTDGFVHLQEKTWAALHKIIDLQGI